MYVEENTQFQLKVVRKSGLDVDGTYLPPAIHPSIADEPKTDMKTAMLEAEMVMCGAVSDLLEKTGERGAAGAPGRLAEGGAWKHRAPRQLPAGRASRTEGRMGRTGRKGSPCTVGRHHAGSC
jgi:hypothetical protein